MGTLEVTPDLKTAAWLKFKKDVLTLTMQTPQRRWQASILGLQGSRALFFAPDKSVLTIPNENGYVQLMDVATGERRATLLLRARPDALAFSPDGQILAVNERSWDKRGSVTLWRLDTAQQVGRVPGLTGVLSPFAFSPDGTLFVPTGRYTVGWVNPQTGGVLRRLKTLSEACPAGGPFKVYALGPRSAHLSADGTQALVNYIHAASGTPFSRLVYLSNPVAAKSFDTPQATATLSPDGKTLILNIWSGSGELQGFSIP